MKKIVFLIIFGIVTIFVISTYNNFVRLNQSVEESWSNVETTLQRRYDLIPNLVETVKGYVSHENKTFKEIVELRGKSMQNTINIDVNDPKSMEKILALQSNMDSIFSKLIALSENYPDLKASTNFLDLQSQLEGTENRINVSRTRYNEAVKNFNSSIEVFPSNIINNLFAKYNKYEYFEANSMANENVKVKF